LRSEIIDLKKQLQDKEAELFRALGATRAAEEEARKWQRMYEDMRGQIELMKTRMELAEKRHNEKLASSNEAHERSLRSLRAEIEKLYQQFADQPRSNKTLEIVFFVQLFLLAIYYFTDSHKRFPFYNYYS